MYPKIFGKYYLPELLAVTGLLLARLINMSQPISLSFMLQMPQQIMGYQLIRPLGRIRGA
jgi:hypothetical protein